MKGNTKWALLLIFCEFHNYLLAQPMGGSVTLADFSADSVFNVSHHTACVFQGGWMCSDLTAGCCGTFSCTLTCQVGGEAERGKVPGPAGDMVPRQTVACDQTSLLFSPLKRTDLQSDSLGVIQSVFRR